MGAVTTWQWKHHISCTASGHFSRHIPVPRIRDLDGVCLNIWSILGSVGQFNITHRRVLQSPAANKYWLMYMYSRTFVGDIIFWSQDTSTSMSHHIRFLTPVWALWSFSVVRQKGTRVRQYYWYRSNSTETALDQRLTFRISPSPWSLAAFRSWRQGVFRIMLFPPPWVNTLFML